MYETEKLVIECLKLVIAIGGFWLVIRQIGFLKRTIESNANAKLYDQYLKVNELFLNNPMLRSYFYRTLPAAIAAEAPKETKDLGPQVQAMCEAVTGVLEHAVLQGVNLPDDPTTNCWKEYIRERYEASPALRQFLVENKRWYAKQLFDLVSQELGVGLPTITKA